MVVRKILEFSVNSSIFTALAVASVTATVIFMTRRELSLLPIFITFSGSWIVYCVNKLTDPEDSVSVPNRARFAEKYGKFMIVIAAFLYLTSLFLALRQNLATLLVALLPVIVGAAYSVLRLKRFFLAKNIIIAVTCPFSVLIVSAFYSFFDTYIAMLYAFFALQVFVNTVVFDIKDIKGDRTFGVQTLPLRLGVKRAKNVCYAIVAILLPLAILMTLYEIRSVAILPIIPYTLLYTKFAVEGEKAKWWYYGLFVDGEYVLLLFSVLFLWLFKNMC